MPERIDVVKPNDNFWKILSAARKQPIDQLREELSNRRILAWDPGETTGQARWKFPETHIELLQIETKDIGQAFQDLERQVAIQVPDHIRAEEYRVYNWMADSHSWSLLHTPQLIGAIKVLAALQDIPISFKLAQQAKAFWNDENLKVCGLYSPGQKHARDACRHLLYYLTFPDQQD